MTAPPDAPRSEGAGPLGVLVVYYAPPEAGWLIDMQLERITRHTHDTEHLIYGAANRLAPALRDRLRAHENVVLPRLPETELRGSREHAFYLDRLAEVALVDGCAHVATLDVDSFPVRDGWATKLASGLSARRPLAGILRAENGDRHLPHPSGLFARADFIRRQTPKFIPERSERYAAFLARTDQRADTGVGYAFALAEAGLDWLPLERTNARNDHYLMGGVYGDAIFHLGAMSRAPLFHRDYDRRPWIRWVDEAPEALRLWRLKRFLEGFLRRKNEKTRKRIVARLKADPEGYIRELRGVPGTPPVPKS